MSTHARYTDAIYADVDSVLVIYKYGRVSSVLVTAKTGSCFELRGRRMWSWLKGWSLLLQQRATTPPSNSLKTSLGSVRNDAQAHRAWERR